MIKSLDPGQAQDLISRGGVDVVDVREPHEWSRGHLAGSRLVPLGRLRAGGRALLPRDGIIFVCAAGIRSDTAARLAADLGYREVYNLSGGTRSWAAAGLPLLRDDGGAPTPAPVVSPASEAASPGTLGLQP